MKVGKNKIISLSSEFGKDLDPAELERDLGLEKGFVEKKTGIKNLHEFSNYEEFFEACKESVRNACLNSKIDLSDLDGIYAAGNMTDFISPTISTRLAQGLGLENIVADSIGAGCVAGIQALKSANNQLIVDSLSGKNSLYAVVSADYITKMTNKDDYKTRVLFSDAVSTAIVTNDNNYNGPNIEKVETRAMPNENLYSLHVKSPTNKDFEGAYWEMEGKKVFGFGVDAFGLSMEALNSKPQDFDYIISHQANLRMLESIEQNYSIGKDKLYKRGVINHGNTSSSTVFVGLEDVLKKESFNKAALISFGADLSYGGVVLSKNS